jgi:hypothetical protein
VVTLKIKLHLLDNFSINLRITANFYNRFNFIIPRAAIVVLQPTNQPPPPPSPRPIPLPSPLPPRRRRTRRLCLCRRRRDDGDGGNGRVLHGVVAVAVPLVAVAVLVLVLPVAVKVVVVVGAAPLRTLLAVVIPTIVVVLWHFVVGWTE